jgi:hypothetical protein
VNFGKAGEERVVLVQVFQAENCVCHPLDPISARIELAD